MVNHKTDEYYNHQINLEDNRELLKGNEMDFSNCKTDVDALKVILDSYIDESNIESFMETKLDFGVTILDSMYLIINKKFRRLISQLDELEAQEEDIEHLMTQHILTGSDITNEERLNSLNMMEEVLVNRRYTKDASTILRVFAENIERTRNFIFGMTRRQFSPKSEKFQNNPKFKMSVNSKVKTN